MDALLLKIRFTDERIYQFVTVFDRVRDFKITEETGCYFSTHKALEKNANHKILVLPVVTIVTQIVRFRKIEEFCKSM